MRLKVRHGIKGMNWNQEKSLWSFKKVQDAISVENMICTVLGKRKTMILLEFWELTQTVNIIIVSWRLKFPDPGWRKEKTFCRKHYNARPWTSLKIMDHVAYLDWTVTLHWLYSSCFHLFSEIKIDYIDIFLSITYLFLL